MLTCKSKVVEKEESTQGKRGYIRNGAIVAVLRWCFDGRDVHEPAAASLAVGVAFQGDTQRSPVIASDVCDVIATARTSACTRKQPATSRGKTPGVDESASCFLLLSTEAMAKSGYA